MSWMQRLYDTYEQAMCKTEEAQSQIWPLGHVAKIAHLEIVLDGNSEAQRIKLLNHSDSQTFIPVTEKSAKRTRNCEPHPLCDELGYLVLGLEGAKNNEKKYLAYVHLLSRWAESEYAHPKVQVVKKYLDKNSLWNDINEVVQFPITYQAKKQRTKVHAPKVFVRWRIETVGDLTPETWKDPTLIQSWIDFERAQKQKTGICHLSGKETRLADGHPKFLRDSSDGARIISQNDWSGFTFLGRFTDDKKCVSEKYVPSQVCEIGYETTQKAHNTLRWLVARQGVRNGDQVTVAWAISGKPIFNPVADWCFDDESDALQADDLVDINAVDHSNDLGYRIATKIKLKLKGYQQELNATEQLSLMVLDSTTAKSGRMSICYYREFLPNEYFKYLNAWYDEYAWYQRITKVQEQPGKSKKVKTTVWVEVPPSPLAIAQAVYGKTLSDELKKQVYATVLRAIAEGAVFPQVLMQAAVGRASNPLAFETWEWKRNLGVACALYKGFYARQTDSKLRKDYSMDIDKNTGRSYCFGRLLAIADKIENMALGIAKENRPTTAMRLMQRFSAQPTATWKNIEEALNPYFMRIQSSYPPLVGAYKNLIGQQMAMLHQTGGFNNEVLDGEYLLGYHLQRRWFEQHRFSEGVWIPKHVAEDVQPAESQE